MSAYEPGDALAPFVPVVDGREHEQELERHDSASRNGYGSGAAGEEEERRKDEKDVEVDTAQPERQRQRRPRQRVVRAPEHPRLPALSIPGLLRRPVQPAIRAHLGGGPEVQVQQGRE